MEDREESSLIASCMVWTGTVGAILCLLLQESASPPRWDLLACVMVSAVGISWRLRSQQLQRKRAPLEPSGPISGQAPPIRLMGRWTAVNQGFRTSLLVAACTVLLLIAGFQDSDVAAGEDTPGWVTLAGSSYVGLIILVWSVGSRAAKAAEGSKTASRVEQAAQEGLARVLPVSVVGPGVGTHAPPPPSSFLNFDPAQPGPYPSKRFREGRTKRRAAALQLVTGQGGTRALFLERPLGAETLAAVLHGRRGWLYWVPTGAVTRPGWSAPAVLALDNGRYVRGWTQDAPQLALPQGEEMGAHRVRGYVQGLQPVQASVLCDQQPRWLGFLFLGVIGLMGVLTLFLGTPGSGFISDAVPVILIALATYFIGVRVARYRSLKESPATTLAGAGWASSNDGASLSQRAIDGSVPPPPPPRPPTK